MVKFRVLSYRCFRAITAAIILDLPIPEGTLMNFRPDVTFFKSNLKKCKDFLPLLLYLLDEILKCKNLHRQKHLLFGIGE